MNTNKKKRTAGVTLVELMVVIGILSTLLSIAIPNFLTWQSSYRFKKAVQGSLSRLSACQNGIYQRACFMHHCV